MTSNLYIQNLKCGGCAHTITTKISELLNISNVKVHVEKSSVSFDYDTDNELTSVKNRLLALGYPVHGDSNSVISKAKSFVSCATGKMTK